MSLIERFNEKNSKLQIKVQKEIAKVEQGTSEKNCNQLVTIIDELKKMTNEESFVPSFPRFIIDSWDYTDPLGLELVDLVEMHKKSKEFK